MKIQRHLTKWYRADGSEIYGSFERWEYKKAATVKAHCKELYTRYYHSFKEYLEQAAYLVIYKTPERSDKLIEVARYTKEEIVDYPSCYVW